MGPRRGWAIERGLGLVAVGLAVRVDKAASAARLAPIEARFEFHPAARTCRLGCRRCLHLVLLLLPPPLLPRQRPSLDHCERDRFELIGGGLLLGQRLRRWPRLPDFRG